MVFLEFDEYKPYAQCAVALIAAFAITERAVGGTNTNVQPTLTWDQFINFAHSRPAFRSGRDTRYIDQFFARPVAGAVELSGKNRSSVERVADLIAALTTEVYFAQNSTLTQARSSSADDQIKSLIEKLAKFSDPKWFMKMMSDVGPEKAGKGECVKRFIRAALDSPHLNHPSFQSMNIFDLKLMKTEYHNLLSSGRDTDANWGLFAVVREARGWVTRNLKNTNMIVRDALWLLPAEKRKEMDFGGFYISAMDDAVFTIEKDVEIEDNNIIAFARQEGAGARRQACKIMFADFRNPHPLQNRVGIIAGPTGDPGRPFLAAWKALLIRPEWYHLPIETILLQLTKDVAQVAKTIMSDVNAIGVLFSEYQRKQTPTVQRRREAFRLLIANDRDLLPPANRVIGNFLSKDIESELRTLIETSYEDAMAARSFPFSSIEKERDFIDQVMDALGDAIIKRWHLIEPAQIILYKELKRTRKITEIDDLTREHLKCLLELTEVASFAATRTDSV